MEFYYSKLSRLTHLLSIHLITVDPWYPQVYSSPETSIEEKPQMISVSRVR
jgi:hypothetical protein